MSDNQRSRRRSYVSKPNFQLKLTIVFMLVVTIVANLVGGTEAWEAFEFEMVTPTASR